MDRLQELRERFAQEPLGRAWGARLEHLAVGYAWVSARMRDDFLIVDGIVQGGITTAVADFAGVYAAMTKLPAGHTPAVNINIHFMRPVKAGETLDAVASVLVETRGTLLVAVSVMARENPDKIKAQATITFAKPKA